MSAAKPCYPHSLHSKQRDNFTFYMICSYAVLKWTLYTKQNFTYTYHYLVVRNRNSVAA